jgi:hypothetical protein
MAAQAQIKQQRKIKLRLRADPSRGMSPKPKADSLKPFYNGKA